MKIKNLIVFFLAITMITGCTRESGPMATTQVLLSNQTTSQYTTYATTQAATEETTQLSTEKKTEAETQPSTEKKTEAETQPSTENKTEVTTKAEIKTDPEAIAEAQAKIEEALKEVVYDKTINVTTYDELMAAIEEYEKNESGRYAIYITNDIDCTGQISLTAKKENLNIALVGVIKSDGTTPSLNFKSFRDSADIVNRSSSDSDVGLKVRGMNYRIENLIIENAPDNGIQIKGSEVCNNIVYNCITRYNNDSGLQIAGGASNNIIMCVDSYRNCDMFTYGGNADGFAIKLNGGKKNVFYSCRAFDNSDDGWDSYDKTNDWESATQDVVYIDCLAWNNAKAKVFTGEYDYNNNKPLDKNLLLVQVIMQYYPDFEEKYNNKTLDYTEFYKTAVVKMADKDVKLLYYTTSSYQGNSNGFKLGSKYTNTAACRYMLNCIAFDHNGAGFDKNNSACNIEIKNAISFNNKYNYHLSGTKAFMFENAYGWAGEKKDDLSTAKNGIKVEVAEPADSVKKETEIREKVQKEIVDKLNNNILPGEVSFAEFF